VDRLTDSEVEQCFDHARTDPAFDLARTLPPPEAGAIGHEVALAVPGCKFWR